MNWINNYVRPRINSIFSRRDVPENLWTKCPNCGSMLFHRELSDNLYVCTECDHHMGVTPRARFEALFDGGIFTEVEVPEPVADPLSFRDQKKYPDRMRAAQKGTGEEEAMLVAQGEIGRTPIVAAGQDFSFMGGSMGMYVGNAIIAAAERAVEARAPLILFSAAGGARMQEGILSLMQMPRTTVAVEMVKEAGLPYIVVLTHPTTGGVTASYAMLGDVHIAEPGALICFAGPRVIEQTIREKLPEGFQRAEYLLDHGMLDRVTHRKNLREELVTVVRMLMGLSPAIQGDLPPPRPPEPVPEPELQEDPVQAAEANDAQPAETQKPVNQASSDVILTRMMALHPKVIDLTLDRVWRLLDALGNPQDSLPPVIHIAGTNGKGSTQALIRAGLEGSGKRVHAYTSPHLVRFHERIRLAGDLISEAALTQVLDECEAANGSDPITYFEITTCAALLAFARTPADYTLLEVGLGGRLDATNVLDPALSVITPVSLDHQQFLGDTVEEIAAEKAGILKRGVPCVVGPQTDAAMEVIEARAERVGAPLIARGQHFHVTEERGRLVFQDETGLLDLPMPALTGPHQIENAGMALAALRHLGFGEDACVAAMENVTWPARMQRLKTGPLIEAAPNAEIILDGGHNPAAGESIANAIAAMPKRPLYLVVGMLNTKDVSGFLRPLAGATKLYGVSIPNQAATLPGEDTVAAARDLGMVAEVAEDALQAVQAIAAEVPNARILVGGSLYFAGAILADNG